MKKEGKRIKDREREKRGKDRKDERGREGGWVEGDGWKERGAVAFY